MKITAKQLKEKYEEDLKQLQRSCKHEKISRWLPAGDLRIIINEVKQCEICWKFISRRINCAACKKDFIISEEEYNALDQLCPECSKKGKYYCSIHNKFYNGPHGCSKCLEFLRQVEKIEKKDKK